MVDKKSKIFFIIFISIAVISIAVTYYRYVVLNNYTTFTDEEIFNESLDQ